MFTFLVVTLLIVVALGWLRLRDQIHNLNSRIRSSAKEERSALERQIAELAGRVWKLEQQLERVPQSSGRAGPEAKPAPNQAAVPQTRAEEATGIAQAPRPIVSAPTTIPETTAATAPHKPVTVLPDTLGLGLPAARPSWSERLRHVLGDGEWEALVAGSLMNKLGALLLVIGIALFLGYSFTRLNPAGRVATAAVISASILTAGVFLERRKQYRVFSRGLISAGWAALYTTAYAMYALPSARVISNPFAGSILLLSVSAGMIAHSLRYRVQAVTAVAYFSTFAALALTLSTPFAVASLIPLSASLLFFAWRFEWHAMALFGLFATYGTCISRGSANAPLYLTTSLFITYWLLFEAFDILRSRRGVQSTGLTWIFPLNAIAFLALTYRAWSIHASQPMWQIAAISALLFFVSAMARVWPGPAAVEATLRDPFDCIRRGTYQAPLTLAAILAGLAILGRVTGFWTNVALVFEAEILYLAGVRFRSAFLRGLARSGFVASLSDVLWTSAAHFGPVTVLGGSLHNWTPSVIVHVCLFYINRVISRAVSGYSFAATGLAVLVIASELAPRNAPLALFLFALALFELASRKQLVDFRIQSYLVALAAVVLALSTGGFSPHAPASISSFFGMCAIGCWLFTARILVVRTGELVAKEIATVRDLFGICGSGFALLTLWILLPGPATAAAWTCLALVWLAIASLLNLDSFRWLAAGILGIAYVRLLSVNLSSAWAEQNIAEQWLIPAFVIGSFYWVWHTFRHIREGRQRSFAPVFTWLAALAALWLLYLGVDRFYVVSAWAMLGLTLLIAGLHLNVVALRRQSYSVWVLAVVSCIFINFTHSGRIDMFARISGASLLIGSLFAGEFLLPRNPNTLGARERHARAFASVAAILLLTCLLYHEVSGGLLTVSWGLEALVCLVSGFPARERILRLQGLAVFALCILKLFLYDLRNLETVYRILSFLALGAILLGVSLIYTRFRTQVQRYL